MHQSPSASPCSVSLCVCACICLCVSVSLCVCVFVCMCMWSRVSLSIPGCPIPCVDQAGLRLIETYLFLPPVCWDQGCVSPCWAEPLHVYAFPSELCGNVLSLCMSASSGGKPQWSVLCWRACSIWVQLGQTLLHVQENSQEIQHDSIWTQIWWEPGKYLIVCFILYERYLLGLSFSSFVLTIETFGFRISILVLFLNHTLRSLQLDS